MISFSIVKLIHLRCEIVQSVCINNPCLNNGICFVNATNSNSELGCVCSPGYTGLYCESFMNACLQNPCGYNGTCFSTSNSSYYCICPNGIVGKSCNLSKLFLEY